MSCKSYPFVCGPHLELLGSHTQYAWRKGPPHGTTFCDPSFRCRWAAFLVCTGPHRTSSEWQHATLLHVSQNRCMAGCCWSVIQGKNQRGKEEKNREKENERKCQWQAHIWAQSSMLRGISPTGTCNTHRCRFGLAAPFVLSLLSSFTVWGINRLSIDFPLSYVLNLGQWILRKPKKLQSQYAHWSSLISYCACQRFRSGAHMFGKLLKADRLVHSIFTKVSNSHLAETRLSPLVMLQRYGHKEWCFQMPWRQTWKQISQRLTLKELGYTEIIWRVMQFSACWIHSVLCALRCPNCLSDEGIWRALLHLPEVALQRTRHILKLKQTTEGWFGFCSDPVCLDLVTLVTDILKSRCSLPANSHLSSALAQEVRMRCSYLVTPWASDPARKAFPLQLEGMCAAVNPVSTVTCWNKKKNMPHANYH